MPQSESVKHIMFMVVEVDVVDVEVEGMVVVFSRVLFPVRVFGCIRLEICHIARITSIIRQVMAPRVFSSLCILVLE